ncbi:hypothetical protein [Lysinibacillus sp. JNUCC 51]|uniref:hypothetical protein n=1 Tax=Lysinibacillus sp. JNUCC-51 TaxID=2792479 RepID=UPI0019350021|nr:hypothetical protein JNUCC51_02780 [Lysinibacillus sp. JNUCC-51]
MQRRKSISERRIKFAAPESPAQPTERTPATKDVYFRGTDRISGDGKLGLIDGKNFDIDGKNPDPAGKTVQNAGLLAYFLLDKYNL